MNNCVKKRSDSQEPATDCLTKCPALLAEKNPLKAELQQTRTELDAYRTLSKILNEKHSPKEFLNQITSLFQTMTQSECVGIRVLNKSGDIPYEAFVGYSKEFWEAENWLSVQKSDCACVRVLAGFKEVFDTKLITAHGAFYCNDVIRFYNQLPPAEQKQFRGFCMKNGYSSVASIPIFYQGTLIGSIHLADQRADHLALTMIEEIERLTPFIGEVLHRFAVENDLRNIIEFTDDAIVSFTIDGLITHWNSGAEKLYGYSADQIIGKSYAMLVPADRNEEFRAICKMLVNGENIQIYQTERLDNDGNSRVVSIGLSTAKDIHGKVFGVTAIHRDISRSKSLEAELEKAHRLESLGTLAAGIAHDFNNYLAVIMANVQLAEIMAAKGKNNQKYLRETVAIIQNAAELTKQLLVFSKGGAPVKKLANVAGLLTRIIRMTAALQQANIRCKLILAEDLWEAEFDESQISLVINNLLANAVQAMPDGGVIEIAAENITLDDPEPFLLKAGEYLRITIKDTGEGIPEENMSKVFDPFFTTRSNSKGLGLAISYSVMQRHGGWIEVQSKRGEGSAFQLYLPATRLRPEPSRQSPGPVPALKKRILLMDDEPVLLESMGELLRDVGYEVELAWDGAVAVEMYQRALQADQPFDAVVLDLTVPGGVGGRAALSRLQTIDPQVKAIVSSGYSNDPVIANFRDYGFQSAIVKPYQVLELHQLLQAMLLDAESQSAGTLGNHSGAPLADSLAMN